jgi:hypothetical protein
VVTVALGFAVGVIVVGTSGLWAMTVEEEDKLRATDFFAYTHFGSSVALDGETALIGCPDDGDNGYGSGSAYLFGRTAGAWTQLAKLLPADGSSSDHFGQSVALDGDTALIGASGDAAGSVYVCTRAGEVWTETVKLLADDGAAGDGFGARVALDGDTAVIGASGDDDHGENSGAAYVFTRIGGIWTQQAKLVPTDVSDGDRFGGSVALDGDTAVVGAIWDDDQGDDSGAAYVFIRAGGGWTQQAKLLPGDGAAGDLFGVVALDGDTALIGASYDDGYGLHRGAAYVFVRVGNVWVEQAKLLPVDGVN